ncbi:DUF6924 domain-containing protein [Verrucosispora sioxanthis]|uniref:DUF6924 domain-containing protein n=1 Tax=Verrucosispora sioxanthis TaxID=2499994 RepID=A0A6M1KTN1_9ACTN|nr:hypothetical protein [Verrucosispora sioxanthis]NEE63285.1 hypothetical protein [Verrucosispora sioxanthis]NGM12395.1 hypothetical protein [Verrucosispora sioxanthis]
MPLLPQPNDLTSLILRTDFTDDRAWSEIQRAVGADGATYASDPLYSDVTVQTLVAADAAAADDDKLAYLFVADAISMADIEHSLLAVDLYAEPGRTFRVPAQWYADVSANLSIANMDFDEFADATDESGTYRGFEDA